MQIEDIIKAIQKRPKMFVDEEKIEYIYHFILGACFTNVCGEDINRKFSCWFWKWLEIWIRENINPHYFSETASWCDEIKMIANEDEEAVRLFYELSQKFFDDYHNKKGYFS